MKCFYHNDLDGNCAAAIVRKWADDEGKHCEFQEMNYNIDFPFGIVEKDEETIIVDFSLQKEGEFEKLLGITKNVIWIDHHKSAIDKHKNLVIDGVRSIGKSGCELTWEYYYDEPLPTAVRLIGDWDTWKFTFGEDTTWFMLGLSAYDINPLNDELWGSLLGDNHRGRLIKYMNEGRIIQRYARNQSRIYMEGWSFYVEFEGHRCLAVNKGMASSKVFEAYNKEDYDIMMPFVWDGKEWTVSMYAKNTDIDVSDIARKHGGGGHAGAAGFTAENLPFRRI